MPLWRIGQGIAWVGKSVLSFVLGLGNLLSFRQQFSLPFLLSTSYFIERNRHCEGMILLSDHEPFPLL